MSRRSIIGLLSLAVVLIVVGGALVLTTDGVAHRVGNVAVMLAGVCSIVAGIGGAFRDARRK